jgi:multidrug efflux pump subunit AcrA (membrane-fusion protein)
LIQTSSFDNREIFQKKVKAMQVKNILVAKLLLVTFFISGCVPASSLEPTSVVPEQEIVSEPEISLDPEIRLIGKVVLRETFFLSFPISGIVKDMLVEEGQTLETGEVIALLDTTAIEEEITRAEASLAVAQKNLERVSLGADQAEINEAQYQLERAKASRALSIVQATQNALDVASAEANLEYLLSLPLPEDVAVAKAQQQEAQSLLEIAKNKLRLAELSSPMNSTVIDLLVQHYEYTTPGRPVVEIGDTNDLLIDLILEDRDFSSIKIGDKANVYINALPDINATAKVVNIRFDETNGVFIAEMEFIEQPDGLLWGMAVEVSFVE